MLHACVSQAKTADASVHCPHAGNCSRTGVALRLDGTEGAYAMRSANHGFPSTAITIEMWVRSTHRNAAEAGGSRRPTQTPTETQQKRGAESFFFF